MKKNGFTLIEIIFSISLMLIIASFSMYRYSFENMFENIQIKQLMSDINYIKQLGLQGDANASIHIDVVNDSYTLESSNDSSYVKLKNIDIVESTVNTVSFYKTSWTKGTTIKFISLGEEYIITISAITGRVQLSQK